MNKPLISIITPNFNGAQYLEETILSILSQNYPNLEYIIIDGGSTDGSIEIIKKHESKISYWVSEPDNGLYHAIQKGFDKSSGDIMGWLNSDDLLHPKSLFTVAEVFSLKNINWIMGIPSTIDEQGKTIEITNYRKWSKTNYYMGDYQYIQQESTFWSRNLYNKAGAYISQEYKYAGDMELWNRFFNYEKLYTLKCLIGGFRSRSKNQLSLDHYKEYIHEAKNILYSNKPDKITKKTIKKIEKIEKLQKIIQASILFNHHSINFRINKYIEKLHSYPNELKYDRIKQSFTL